jgi:recombination protein RecT
MTNQDVITRDQDRNMPVGNSLTGDLKGLEAQFKFALPAHIPVERFMRVVVTAVQREPKLRKCTKQSFFNACMQAANDGLLPDGREGAIVPFGEDEGGGKKSDIATWMPMIFGIRKKVRNAGVLSDWNVQVVQQGDQFDFELGDEPYIKHKPSPTGGRARPVLFAYSIATYPDGTKSREVMNIDQIRDIEKLAKAKRGPWSNPIFFPEMARKTVAKLHAKQLPMSTDLDRLLHRDDALYDFTGAADQRAKPEAIKRPASVAAALNSFADDVPDEPDDPPLSDKPAEAPPAGDAAKPPAEQQNAQQETPEAIAWRKGQDAKAKGMTKGALPLEYREGHASERHAWEAGHAGQPLPLP